MPLTNTQNVELRNKRKGLAEQANAILKAANAESRDMTAEEAEKFDRLHTECDSIKARIEREERQAKVDAELRESAGTRAGHRDTRGTWSMDIKADDEQRRALHNATMRNYCRYGLAGLSAEQRNIMLAAQTELPEELRDNEEFRALSASTGNVGGYTVPPDTSMYGKVDEALLQYGQILEVSQVMDTSTGADMPIPTDNDTTNMGAIVAENAQVTAQDIAFGQVTLKSYMFTSKIILVPFQLLQDSAVNIDEYVGRKIGIRLGRALANYATIGTNSSQPQGVVPAANVGKTAPSGQTSSVTYADVVDLEHSVDPAYRPKSRYMFHDTTLQALKKLLDGLDRPLWLPGMAANDPDTINGYPYTINQSVPQLGASNRAMLFGDFEKFIIRRVQGTQVLRLTERYADYLQVGFLGFQRWDSKLIDAGTHPIQAFVCAAS